MTQTDGDTTIAQKVNFFGVSASDYAVFPKISKALNRYAAAALDAFYAKVRETPDTARMFANDAAIAHAKSKQIAHWRGLFSGEIDDRYAASAETIGNIHARIGLKPTWYIGGYARVLYRIITDMHSHGKGLVCGRSVATLVKLGLLDMEIALSAYFKAEEQARQAVVDQVGQALAEVAKGNFSTPLSGLPAAYSRIEEDFERMREEIQSALRSVAEGASTINVGAGEIRQASDDLANRTEHQAASLEETSAAMSELSLGVREAADGAREMSRSVGQASAEAAAGSEVVAGAVRSMDQIQRTAREISKITDVIDEIAFQTNLLALNAGVEAARAGDAGKGFAVVANEVRLLAQRSAESANNIKLLIKSSTEEVANGVALVGKSGQAFDGIATKIADMERVALSIAELAETQALNLQQVNSAVHEMDQMTQHNAAMVEQSNAASRSLATEATELADLVRRFDLGLPASGNNLPSATSISRGKSPAKRAPAFHGNAALAEDWNEF